jgi:hypothetical protein
VEEHTREAEKVSIIEDIEYSIHFVQYIWMCCIMVVLYKSNGPIESEEWRGGL